MTGIYIHIPFCKQKCHYCNFFSVATTRYRDEFLRALHEEIEQNRDYLDAEEVTTIYFGGGTPSLLSPGEIRSVIDRLREFFPVFSGAEITLEANPDDVNRQKSSLWLDSGVNRISLGVQSFHDKDLEYLNRVHNASSALESIETLKNAGFDNLTIDLIYGMPTLTGEKWEQNLDIFTGLGINHLSAYALTVESKTALAHLISKKKLPDINEEEQVNQFNMLIERMEKEGFVHYEISNFARPGHYSKHNSIYWLGGHYLGLGPSAHSYNGHTRQWNSSSLRDYIDPGTAASPVEETEHLTTIQKFNEYVMTSLRTVWGCDLEHIRNVFGKGFSDQLLKQAESYLISGKIDKTGEILSLTREGKLYADGIAADLFLEE